MQIEELVSRLEKGVQSRVERWPGNDGEDIVHDIAGACRAMQEAATAITILSQSIDSIQRENDRYVLALERIGEGVEQPRHTARKALSG